MIVARKIFSVIVLMALWFLISALGCFFVISQVFKPTILKAWLAADSGYEKLVPVLKSSFVESVEGDIDKTSQLIVSSITPELVRQEVEIVIDRYFSWLKGESIQTTISGQEIEDLVLKQVGLSSKILTGGVFEPIPDITLPLLNNDHKATMSRNYRLVFDYQPYILGLIVILMITLVLLRFHFRDRVGWLFWAILVPTLGGATTLGVLFFAGSILSKPPDFLAKLDQTAQEEIIFKIQSLLDLLKSSLTKVILIEAVVLVFFLVIYIIAVSISNKPTKVNVAESLPPAPIKK